MNLSDRINDTYAMPLLVIEEIRKLEARLEAAERERDALSAHLERLLRAFKASTVSGWAIPEESLDEVFADSPQTSLARQKLLWQAEALGRMKAALNTSITELRRQAEGGEET